MAKQHYSDFDGVDWCQKLIKDGSQTEINGPAAEQPINIEDTPFFKTLLKKTLATSETIRVCRAFCKPIKLDSGLETIEVKMLYSLGSAMNGHVNIAHGGMVCTLVDEVMGTAGMLRPGMDYMIRAMNIMTGEMTVRYQKPVATPCLLLIRAWTYKLEGRKIYVQSTIEDGQGNVLTKGHGIFIRLATTPPTTVKAIAPKL